jgi:hypothetical protein
LAALKVLNHCQHVAQRSPKWEIFAGMNENVFPPKDMSDILDDLLLYRIPPQQIIIFESREDAYVAMCQTNLIPEVIKIAILNGSENAFTFVKELAQPDTADKTTINVINVFDLMKDGQFVKHQDCHYLKKPDPGSIVLMVSHRWKTKEHPDIDPDPDRIQFHGVDRIQFHGVVRFVIQACMMAMSSTPQVFNSVDFSEVILCPDLFIRLHSLYQKYASEVLAGVDPYECEASLLNRSNQLLQYLLQTIGEENTLLVVNDISPLTYMMSHIDIWYDFTSLPQGYRTSEELLYFDNELSKLDQYFSEYYTVIIWSKSSLKRGWCFFEALVSTNSDKRSIFSSEKSKVSSTNPAPINELSYTISKIEFGDHSINLSDLSESFREMMQEKDANESEKLRLIDRKKETVDLSQDLTKELNKIVHEANWELRGKSEMEILSYLRAHEYECTNGSDRKLIAKKLADHYERSRQSPR